MGKKTRAVLILLAKYQKDMAVYFIYRCHACMDAISVTPQTARCFPNAKVVESIGLMQEKEEFS